MKIDLGIHLWFFFIINIFFFYGLYNFNFFFLFFFYHSWVPTKAIIIHTFVHINAIQNSISQVREINFFYIYRYIYIIYFFYLRMYLVSIKKKFIYAINGLNLNMSGCFYFYCSMSNKKVHLQIYK